MNQAEIYQFLVKIDIVADSETEAYDGIGSILNDAAADDMISDWAYSSINPESVEKMKQALLNIHTKILFAERSEEFESELYEIKEALTAAKL